MYSLIVSRSGQIVRTLAVFNPWDTELWSLAHKLSEASRNFPGTTDPVLRLPGMVLSYLDEIIPVVRHELPGPDRWVLDGLVMEKLAKILELVPEVPRGAVYWLGYIGQKYSGGRELRGNPSWEVARIFLDSILEIIRVLSERKET